MDAEGVMPVDSEADTVVSCAIEVLTHLLDGYATQLHSGADMRDGDSNHR